MASNSFGTIFKCTTWGESHGKAIGVVIDGCPAGLAITEEEINAALKRRAPGQNPYTSPRKEEDAVEILSGVFEGKTTGAPISLIIWNHDADSTKYEPIKALLRPGHAQFTYLEKYGVFDYRGGGRASARETAARVAAGAIARKLLAYFDISIAAYLKSVGSVTAQRDPQRPLSAPAPLFCPDPHAEKEMVALLEATLQAGDSVGGVVEFIASGLPKGLGDPVYEKLEANLAKAMLSLPASKGFEIGEGFQAALMKGSEHNDLFVSRNGQITLATNQAGGLLGGITTGAEIVGRVAFKPPSSLRITQKTTTLEGEEAQLKLPEGSRHDPCVAIRAVPVVEAMLALTLVDALLLNRCAKL